MCFSSPKIHSRICFKYIKRSSEPVFQVLALLLKRITHPAKLLRFTDRISTSTSAPSSCRRRWSWSSHRNPASFMLSLSWRAWWGRAPSLWSPWWRSWKSCTEMPSWVFRYSVNLFLLFFLNDRNMMKVCALVGVCCNGEILSQPEVCCHENRWEECWQCSQLLPW